VSVASVHLTGRMRVVGPLGTLEAAALPSRQARLVLASLAVTDPPGGPGRAGAAAVGRPAAPASQRDLPVIVSRLRSLLARIGWPEPSYITSDASSYQLRTPVDVDVRTAHRSLAAAAAALAGSRPGEALARACGDSRDQRPAVPIRRGRRVDRGGPRRGL
jgi:hypothetical protein